MKNKELFHKTVGILVNAYQKETLRHCDCSACAVGNMVAANMGLKTHPKESKFIVDGSHNRYPTWYDAFNGNDTDVSEFSQDSIKECESTGYSVLELVEIEGAFEGRGTRPALNKDTDKDGFKGLMNVVDVLMKIHNANETEIKEAKQLFVKA